MKKDIAIFVNSFIRDDLMYRCVEECEKHIPNGRIYLTDNGSHERMTDEKRKFYDEMQQRGHIVVITDEFNYWWRRGFNDKIDMLQDEKYVLKMDDDFTFEEDSGIEKLQQYLEANKDLGMIGGKVWHARSDVPSDYIFNVDEEDGKPVKKDGKYVLSFAQQYEDGFIYCDMIPDFWLARREIFDDIRMENDLQPAQGGHEVFFRKIYNMRKKGTISWRVGYTNECVTIHEKATQTEEYKHHRLAGFKSEQYYAKIGVIKPKLNTKPEMKQKYEGDK